MFLQQSGAGISVASASEATDPGLRRERTDRLFPANDAGSGSRRVDLEISKSRGGLKMAEDEIMQMI